jgi:hypothetical protein
MVVSLAYNPNGHTQGLDDYTNRQARRIALGIRALEGEVL